MTAATFALYAMGATQGKLFRTDCAAMFAMARLKCKFLVGVKTYG